MMTMMVKCPCGTRSLREIGRAYVCGRAYPSPMTRAQRMLSMLVRFAIALRLCYPFRTWMWRTKIQKMRPENALQLYRQGLPHRARERGDKEEFNHTSRFS